MILPNSLYGPGTKLTITKRTKHKTIAPGSTCFMSRFGASFMYAPNVMTLELVITKNGKRGKDRVDRAGVATTVFPIEFEKRPLKNTKHQGNPVVELEYVPFDPADLTNVSEMDFMGWAYAYKLYLRGLFNELGIAHKWPTGKAQPVNCFRNVALRMHKTPKETIELISHPEFRQKFIKQLRALEAGLPQAVLGEKTACAIARLKALACMMWTQQRKKDEDLYDMDMLRDNYMFYRDVAIKEQSNLFNARLKRWNALPAKKRKAAPKPKPGNKPSTANATLKYLMKCIEHQDKPPFDDIVLPNNNQAPNKIWYHQPNDAVFVVEEA